MPRRLPVKKLTPEQQQLVEDNIGLVGRIATKLANTAWAQQFGVSADELFSMGVHGLIRAVQKFDRSKARLSTYSNFWIHQAIYRQMDNWLPIRVPKAALCELKRKGPLTPRTKAAEVVSRSWKRPDSMPEDSWETLQDKGACDIESRELVSLILNMMQFLPEREQMVMRMRYGINKEKREYTLIEVARILGVTKERVRQLQDHAIRFLQRLTNGYAA